MSIEYKNEGAIGIMFFSDYLDATNVSDLKSKFQEAIHENNLFIFDLADLDFIDSTGLGGLVSCLKQATQLKGDVKVCSLNEKPRLLFELTRANQIFEVYEDLDSAQKAYS